MIEDMSLRKLAPKTQDAYNPSGEEARRLSGAFTAYDNQRIFA